VTTKDNERKFIFMYRETKLYKCYNESLNIFLRIGRGRMTWWSEWLNCKIKCKCKAGIVGIKKKNLHDNRAAKALQLMYEAVGTDRW